MAIKDELGIGWIRNSSPLRPLRKPERHPEPPEDNPLEQLCANCKMPMWMCDCEQ